MAEIIGSDAHVDPETLGLHYMDALDPAKGRRAQSSSFGLGRWPTGASPHPRRGTPRPQDER